MRFQKQLGVIICIVLVFSSPVVLAKVIKKTIPLQSGNVKYSFVENGEEVAQQLVDAISGEVMETTGVVPDGPKLIKIDLQNDQTVQKISFNQEIAPIGSYLNDVRVDTDRNYAYLTDSGEGAIVVVNLNTGHSRRLLHDHPWSSL